MKVIGIIALTAMIAIPSSSLAWGPRQGGGVVRPFFRGVVVGRHFGRVPFGFFPNRAFIAPNLFIPPAAYGSYYSPTYAHPPPYSYYAVSPPSALGTAYDRGYSEGYSRGYEEALKELSRERHEEDKTTGDEQGKESGEGGQ